MPINIARIVLLLSVCLAGCVDRAVLADLPTEAVAKDVVPIFTATNRSLEASLPGDGRSDEVVYSRIDVSVPPDRVPGAIATPTRGAANPVTDFLVADETSFGGATGFRKAVSRALRKLPASERDVLIYVHGFNNNFADGVLRMAQLSHDLNVRGLPLHFSWPSSANPLGYVYDRASALYSRDQLEDFIRLVQVPEARRVIVVAHSMGGFLTMEALRQMEIRAPGRVHRDIDGVVLLSPDIDIDVFRTQAAEIKRLPSTFVIFQSENDRALGLSARLTGLKDRLGNIADKSRISEFDITLVNVTEFSSGLGHFSPGSSPDLIRILANADAIDTAFSGGDSGRTGLLPGTVITVQNLTELVLPR